MPDNKLITNNDNQSIPLQSQPANNNVVITNPATVPAQIQSLSLPLQEQGLKPKRKQGMKVPPEVKEEILIRLARNETQTQIQDATGVAHTTISKYFNNKNNKAKICKYKKKFENDLVAIRDKISNEFRRTATAKTGEAKLKDVAVALHTVNNTLRLERGESTDNQRLTFEALERERGTYIDSDDVVVTETGTGLKK